MRIVLVGSGKMLYFLAKRFVARNFDVVAVTEDESEARSLARGVNAKVLLGDGTTPLLLRDAEAGRADVLLALLPSDEDNLVAGQVAQRMFGVPRVVAVVNDPDNVELFERLGIHATFSSTELVAQVIEERASISEVMTLLPLAGGRVRMSEISLPSGAPSADQRVRDLKLPDGALIAMVLRDDRVVVPSGDTELWAGDRLVLVSQPEDHGRALRLLLGEQA